MLWLGQVLSLGKAKRGVEEKLSELFFQLLYESKIISRASLVAQQ